MFNFNDTTFDHDHDAVIAELQSFESNTLVHPQIIQVNGINADIPYGAYGDQTGTIHMRRGNYQITGYTPLNGVQVNLPAYNYTGNDSSKLDILTSGADIRNAFLNHELSMVFIIILSESCRSNLVKSVVQKLVSTNSKNLTLNQKTGLWAAINTYGQVAASTQVHPLTTQAYETFFNTRQAIQKTQSVNPANAVLDLSQL